MLQKLFFRTGEAPAPSAAGADGTPSRPMKGGSGQDPPRPSPAEGPKPKRPRFTTTPGMKKAALAAATAAEKLPAAIGGESEDAGVEEGQDDEGPCVEEHFDLKAQVELAEAVWCAAPPQASFANVGGKSATKAQDIGSATFVPEASSKPLPFALLAQALEEDSTKDAHRPLRALANIARCAMRNARPGAGDPASPREVDELESLFTCLDGDVTRIPKVYQNQLLASVAAALAVTPPKNPTAEELAKTALTARRKQKTLFQPKPLALRDVAGALGCYKAAAAAANAGTASATGAAEGKDAAPPALVEVLRRSVATDRETWHLVKTLHRAGPPIHLVLRALAHALALEVEAAAVGRVLAEAMVSMEVALNRTFSARGHASPALFASAFRAALACDCTAKAEKALLATCPAVRGCPVLPQCAEPPCASGSVQESLSRLGADCGAVLAECILAGERAQIHVSIDAAGPSVSVFSAREGASGTGAGVREEQRLATAAKEAIRGAFQPGLTECILDAVFLRPSRKQDRKQKPSDAPSEGQAADGEPQRATEDGATTDGSGTRSAAQGQGQDGSSEPDAELVVGVSDILLLNGESLLDSSLRDRRSKLHSILALLPGPGREGAAARLRVVPSRVFAADGVNEKEIMEELLRGLKAFHTADFADKAFARSCGLLLKRLDGPESQYVSGRVSRSWQEVRKPPDAIGPEADANMFAQLSENEQKNLPESSGLHFCVVSARRTQTEEGVADIKTVESQFQACGVTPRWYVDEASLQDYRALGLDAVVGGKLIPARNMALDDADKLGKACVQISDDISRWEYAVGESYEDGKPKPSLGEANGMAKAAAINQISPVAAARFMLAKLRSRPDPKPRLAGVYPLGNLGQAMASCKPFTYNNFVLGDFFVTDHTPCRFDTRMTLKEDYDFTCSNLKEDGSLVRCNRMLIHAKHETNAGGACTVRDAQGERERENIKILREKWPGAFTNNWQRSNQVILFWRRHLKYLREKQAEETVEKGTAEAIEKAESGA